MTKKGDVYNCCHLKPFKIGNIHDSKLKELINTQPMREYRKQSLHGDLQCYHSCNLVNKNIPPDIANTGTEVNYQDLRYIHISFGEACNIRCVMCEHPGRHAKDGTILDSSAVIDRVDIAPFEGILIQGGEPLAITSALEYMGYLETMKKKYILLTNGLLIDDSRARMLADNAKTVSISLNAATKETHEAINVGSDFDRVLSNIERLRRTRLERATEVVLCGRMTLTTGNLHEIPMFLKEYRTLGFDVVNFGYDAKTVPSYLKENLAFRENLREKIGHVLANARTDEIDLRRLRQLELVRDDSEPSV